MFFAASQGHLHCMKIARNNGMSFCGATLNFAAKKGNVHCLKYIFENYRNDKTYQDYRFSFYTVYNAVRSENYDNFAYVLSKIDLRNSMGLRLVCEEILQLGNLKMLQLYI